MHCHSIPPVITSFHEDVPATSMEVEEGNDRIGNNGRLFELFTTILRRIYEKMILNEIHARPKLFKRTTTLCRQYNYKKSKNKRMRRGIADTVLLVQKKKMQGIAQEMGWLPSLKLSLDSWIV